MSLHRVELLSRDTTCLEYGSHTSQIGLKVEQLSICLIVLNGVHRCNQLTLRYVMTYINQDLVDTYALHRGSNRVLLVGLNVSRNLNQLTYGGRDSLCGINKHLLGLNRLNTLFVLATATYHRQRYCDYGCQY